MKENDYKTFLRGEYPYSFYEHCSVDYNDLLSGQQPWTNGYEMFCKSSSARFKWGPNSSYGDNYHGNSQNHSLQKTLLDFYLIKQRENKINQILK